MSEESCGNCRHYRTDADYGYEPDGLGTCHRRSPMPATEPGRGSLRVWPPVQEDEWCGEWAQRPTSDDEAHPNPDPSAENCDSA